jgi:hypothetical protein
VDATDQRRLARATVDRLLRWAPHPDDRAVLESAEVVEVAGEGPAVVVLWSQGPSGRGHGSFGLLTTVEQVLADLDAALLTQDEVEERWLGELRLLVVEPHGGPQERGAAPGTRTWFVRVAPRERTAGA